MSISGYIFASIVLIKIIKSFFDGVEDVNDPVSQVAMGRKSFQ